MPIKGISDTRRLPRLGSIRLGVKAKTDGGKEYPKETSWFTIDPALGSDKLNEDAKKEFYALYGEKPTTIKVMFPPTDPSLFFSVDRKRYGSGTLLKCKGDGESAGNPGEAVCGTPEWAQGLEVLGNTSRGMLRVRCLGEECPYTQQGECSPIAVLQILLPELKGIGVWKITTGSIYNIIAIGSFLDWLRGLCGRVSMIPLTLARVPTEIQHDGKKRTHYLLKFNQDDLRLSDLQRAALVDMTKVALTAEDDDDRPEELPDLRPRRVFQIGAPTTPAKSPAAPTAQAGAPTPEPAPTLRCSMCKHDNEAVRGKSPETCAVCGNALPKAAPASSGSFEPVTEWVDAFTTSPDLATLERDWRRLTVKPAGAYWTFSGPEQVRIMRAKDKRKATLTAGKTPQESDESDAPPY